MGCFYQFNTNIAPHTQIQSHCNETRMSSKIRKWCDDMAIQLVSQLALTESINSQCVCVYKFACKSRERQDEMCVCCCCCRLLLLPHQPDDPISSDIELRDNLMESQTKWYNNNQLNGCKIYHRLRVCVYLWCVTHQIFDLDFNQKKNTKTQNQCREKREDEFRVYCHVHFRECV